MFMKSLPTATNDIDIFGKIWNWLNKYGNSPRASVDRGVLEKFESWLSIWQVDDGTANGANAEFDEVTLDS